VSLLGVPVGALTVDHAVTLCEQAIRRRSRLLLGVVNAAKLVSMYRNQTLCRAVRAADVILADGASIVGASHVLRRHLPERVTGIDLMIRLLQRADQHGYRVYYLGATAEVLDEVTRRIARDYPGARIVGRRDGYFPVDEEPAVANAIARANPDMLFVAMSSPKKELFMARWAEHMNVPVCHGVGGAFDVLAGKVKRAPQRWQRLGLEWLYRVVQEPGRMWRRYLVTNTLFCGLVGLGVFANGRSRGNGRSGITCGEEHDCIWKRLGLTDASRPCRPGRSRMPQAPLPARTPAVSDQVQSAPRALVPPSYLPAPDVRVPVHAVTDD
jgi:N-acetylglucosaminyldiphosphoundecaprenol N-acetyl-beta-D-mannosaminyltransferase